MRSPTPARFIYFILDEDRNAVKIGVSGDPSRRLKDLQTGHAGALRLLGSIKQETVTERALHRRFSLQRIRGEWFRHEGDLMQYVRRLSTEAA